ncbi:hypothetical protein [Micromonospora craterilacus]|uniref:hypothetical protein n=1 Tax=Micromonospora craterilacus TaxID=1655439 RepID=UPI001F22DE17|nr:hypothetical protein [Micromonospora craterilacus]
MARVVRAVALVAVGVVLVVDGLAGPSTPAVEPRPMRPATDQERREHEVQRLSDAIDELRQQEGATAGTP